LAADDYRRRYKNGFKILPMKFLLMLLRKLNRDLPKLSILRSARNDSPIVDISTSDTTSLRVGIQKSFATGCGWRINFPLEHHLNLFHGRSLFAFEMSSMSSVEYYVISTFSANVRNLRAQACMRLEVL